MEFALPPRDLRSNADVSPDDQQPLLDNALRRRWTEAADAGVCRYRLTCLLTKILVGKYRFVAQLNSQRATLRRRPQDLQLVDAPFDPKQFNFNRVQPSEILLILKSDGIIQGNVIINVSPLEFGNSLLVPSPDQCLPQQVTLAGLKLLIQVMVLCSNRDLRSGFNSPGGYASVNHQHFHLYYLKHRLFLETVDVTHLTGPCYVLENFPSKGFAFQLVDNDIQSLATNVFRLVSFLREKSIAHNLFLTTGKSFGADCSDTLRVFVWARHSTFGAKEEFAFNPAMCELAGHLLIKEEADFETVNEDQVSDQLHSITRPYYDGVRPQLAALYASQA